MLGILMKSKFSITQKESRYNISKQNNCIGDRAECSQCGKWLHKRGLKRHIEDVHNHSSAKQEFVCDVCNKSFKTPQYLKNHLRLAHSIYQQHNF